MKDQVVCLCFLWATVLVFLVGFPLAFLGRTEGGFPDFVYGVPVVASRLLLIPPVTASIGVAASIAVVGIWRDGRASMAARFEHSLVAVALLSFDVFAWYWHLLPTRQIYTTLRLVRPSLASDLWLC